MKELFVYALGIISVFSFSFNVLSQPLYKPKRCAFTAQIVALSIHEGPQRVLISYPPVKALLAYQAEGKIPYIVTDMVPNFVLRLHIQSESPQGSPLQKGAKVDFGIHSPTLFFPGVDMFDEDLMLKEETKEENLPFILLYVADEEHAVYKLVFDWIRYVEGHFTTDTMSLEQMNTSREDFEHMKEREESMLQQLEKHLIGDMEKIRQKSQEDAEK
jgi:hypothetical protein